MSCVFFVLFFFFLKNWIAKKHCYILPQHNPFDQLSACFVSQTLWLSWGHRSVPFSPFSLLARKLTHYGEDLRARISLSPLLHPSLTLRRVITLFIGKIIKGKPTLYISCFFAKLHASFLLCSGGFFPISQMTDVGSSPFIWGITSW